MKVQNIKEGSKPYIEGGVFFKPPWHPRDKGVHRPGKTMEDKYRAGKR